MNLIFVLFPYGLGGRAAPPKTPRPAANMETVPDRRRQRPSPLILTLKPGLVQLSAGAGRGKTEASVI